MPEYLTRAEVARLLKVTPQTVDNWVKTGRLPTPLKISPKAIRFVAADVREAVEKMGLSTDSPKAPTI